MCDLVWEGLRGLGGSIAGSREVPDQRVTRRTSVDLDKEDGEVRGVKSTIVGLDGQRRRRGMLTLARGILCRSHRKQTRFRQPLQTSKRPEGSQGHEGRNVLRAFIKRVAGGCRNHAAEVGGLAQEG